MAANDTKEKTKFGTAKRIVFWIIMYGALMIFIYARIQIRFGVILEEQALKVSINRYYMTLGFMLMITLLFSIGWWLMALLPGIRYFFERNTFLIAVIFMILLGIINAAVCVPNWSVQDSVREYRLYYGFAFWTIFCFNLFCVPPKAVETVLLGKSLRRWIMGMITMLLTVGIFFT